MQRDETHSVPPITITTDVIAYMDTRGGDFRISTSCRGPVLMPLKVKPAKSSDVPIMAGKHLIYISCYQLPWITEINMRLVSQNLYIGNDDL
ncbi:MAG: hypothetical protein LBU24_06065 [Methanocalculaceae archaeon]|nr:hypothetical protein [Methanocalculaceae archaeon]